MIVLFEPTTLILARLSLLFPSGFRSGYLTQSLLSEYPSSYGVPWSTKLEPQDE